MLTRPGGVQRRPGKAVGEYLRELQGVHEVHRENKGLVHPSPSSGMGQTLHLASSETSARLLSSGRRSLVGGDGDCRRGIGMTGMVVEGVSLS